MPGDSIKPTRVAILLAVPVGLVIAGVMAWRSTQSPTKPEPDPAAQAKASHETGKTRQSKETKTANKPKKPRHWTQLLKKPAATDPFPRGPGWIVLSCDELLARPKLAANGAPLCLPDPTELKRISRAGKYRRLQGFLDRVQREAEQDPRRERWVSFALEAIESTHLGRFDAWIAARPDSAMALLARAGHHVSAGLSRRGTRWASATKPKQWDEMHKAFGRALRDLRAGLEKNPRIVYGHVVQMKMALSGGDRYGSVGEHYARAVRIAPKSFALRWYRMWSLLPRWGGSHAEMKRFAAAQQHLAGFDPRMRALGGLIEWDRADLTRDDRARVRLMSAALKKGEHPLFFRYRGSAYSRLKQYPQSFADYDRAVQLSPTKVEARLWRAIMRVRVKGKAGRVASLEDVGVASRLGGGKDPKLLRYARGVAAAARKR